MVKRKYSKKRLFLFQSQNLHPLSSQMVLLTLAHTKNTQLLNRLYTTLYHELPPMGGYDQVVNSLNYYIAFCSIAFALLKVTNVSILAFFSKTISLYLLLLYNYI